MRKEIGTCKECSYSIKEVGTGEIVECAELTSSSDLHEDFGCIYFKEREAPQEIYYEWVYKLPNNEVHVHYELLRERDAVGVFESDYWYKKTGRAWDNEGIPIAQWE